jgi:hypothetical protein
MTDQTASPQRPDDALRSLPLLAVPDDVWTVVAARVGATAPPRRRRGRFAVTAALIGAVGALLLLPQGRQPTHGIAALVAQSQQVEQRIAAQPAAAQNNGRAALIYGITELDCELAPLSIEPARDPQRAEQLWRTRVRMLETLAELDRADAAREVLSI